LLAEFVTLLHAAKIHRTMFLVLLSDSHLFKIYVRLIHRIRALFWGLESHYHLLVLSLIIYIKWMT